MLSIQNAYKYGSNLVTSCTRLLNRGRAEELGFPFSERCFIATLVFTSVILHLFMAVNMGAKFWWDSITYFQLADAIRNNSLRALYEGPFGIVFQHLTPGLPLLIVIFESLFGSAMWLAFATFQNGLDIISGIYFATAFSRHISRSGQLAIVFLTSAFPYFSSFHNSILTESVTSSLVMIVTGIALRSLEARLKLIPALFQILIFGVIGGQIRSYVIGISAGLSLLIVFNQDRFSRPWLYAIVLMTTAAGILIFPIYRTAEGIEFFLPRVDALMLMHANYVNWEPDERSKHAIEDVVLDPAIARKLETPNSDVGPNDVVKMVDDLVRAGLSRAQAVSSIKQAAWIVRTQSWEVIGRQLQLSLSSLGLQRISTCCDPTRELANGYTGRKMLAHLQFYYRWNAGLDPNDYTKLFDIYSNLYRANPQYYSKKTIEWYTTRIGPHVVAHPSPWRDFLKLDAISPDLLVVLGVSGFMMMGFRDWKIIFILGLLVFPIYGASVSTVLVGDNRYAHLLWPFYITGIVAFFDCLFSGLARVLNILSSSNRLT